MIKHLARAEARKRRAVLHATSGLDAGERAARHFLAAVALAPGALVAGYWPAGDEFDSRPLLRALHERGHPCALPVVQGPVLEFAPWSPGSPLVRGRFGIPVPEGQARVVPPVLLVPLLAFDAVGHRLGTGGGYYDRTLETLRDRGQVQAIGLAFAGQFVPVLPREATDQALDWVVTEEEARKFS